MARHWAEDVARVHLEALGWQCLAENYSIRGAEVDLIMQDTNVLVFVEVKQRRSDAFGSAAEAVDAKKLARMQQVALHFVAKQFKHLDVAMRFDVVLLSGSRTKFTLQHLRNIS